jgi:hypothetical protein
MISYVIASLTAVLLWRSLRETWLRLPPFETAINAVVICFFAIFQRHDETSLFLRYFQIALLCAMILLLVRGMMRHRAARLSALASIMATTLIVVFGVAGNHLTTGTEAVPNLSSPLRNGTYYVVQGGNNPLLNAHRFSARATAQRYAMDFTKLSGLGRHSASFLPGQDPSDYLIYNEPVHAPCDGSVISMADGFADLPAGQTDSQNPAGNYVAIGCDIGVTVVLAHLRTGIGAKLGERVRVGQAVGRVGNSGNSTEPHLHMHLVSGIVRNERELLFLGDGIVVTVDGETLYRGRTLVVGSP